MPCDAIATTWAKLQVSTKEMLEQEKYRKALEFFLDQTLFVKEVQKIVTTKYAVLIRLKDGRTLQIFDDNIRLYGESNQIKVDQIKDFLEQLNGLYTQEKVVTLVESFVEVTEKAIAPNGSVVLKFSIQA